tara:strand:+ start:509 stop:994 length:486 start_codon:yes stop_codon:yes gene_type:complete
MNKNKIGKHKIIKIFTTWRFVFFLIWKLPMGFLARLRVSELTRENANITVPYNYWNKNPFNSMYFAVQAMAAELSTGVLTILHADGQNISMLVAGLDSKYYKKATTQIKFICLDGLKVSKCIEKAIVTGEAQICTMHAKGYDLEGSCVSAFDITWSLKKRI